MRFKTIIIDDETPARSRLRKLLAALPKLEIVDEAGDGLEAIRKIESIRPDLIFLDIQIPGLNGFEMLRALDRKKNLPFVIFVTAYDEHALAAFEANAVAYLLKPISRQQLQRAVERACTLIENEPEHHKEKERIAETARHLVRPIVQVPARKRNHIVLLNLDSIYWFKVEDGVVRVKTDDDVYWTNYSIGELEARLPQQMFFQTNRSTIINLQKVREIVPFFKNTFSLSMKDAEKSEVRVSERRSKKLRELLK